VSSQLVSLFCGDRQRGPLVTLQMLISSNPELRRGSAEGGVASPVIPSCESWASGDPVPPFAVVASGFTNTASQAPFAVSVSGAVNAASVLTILLEASAGSGPSAVGVAVQAAVSALNTPYAGGSSSCLSTEV